MFKKHFFATLILALLLLTNALLFAQSEEGEIFIISERVGAEIDPKERAQS